jgi:hypothetical protein
MLSTVEPCRVASGASCLSYGRTVQFDPGTRYVTTEPTAEELHRARVIELGKQAVEQYAELLARLMDDNDEALSRLADDEPESRGVGWCAPSP